MHRVCIKNDSTEPDCHVMHETVELLHFSYHHMKIIENYSFSSKQQDENIYDK